MMNKELLQQAYAAGWKQCAAWSDRDDLIADIDSLSYRVDMARSLAAIAQPEQITEANYDSLINSVKKQPAQEGDAKDAPYLEALILERNTAQEGLDNAMKALQNYSRIKGVRQRDIASASYAPALWKKRLDAAIAAIASQKGAS